MKFPDAPHSLKMACGENPKRVYGNRGKARQQEWEILLDTENHG
jgi:hypothetical protein